MKKVLSILALAVLCVLPLRQTVTAQCQANDDQFGTVKLLIPTLPTTGEYTLWTRMQVPNSEDTQYRLQVNGTDCYEVGGSSVQPNTWQWVSFQDGDLSRKVTFDFQKTSGNTLKLIGTNPGVRLDRVLLVRGDCVPSELGNNCESSGALLPMVINGATEVAPPFKGPAKGKIIPSPLIYSELTNNSFTPQLQKVIYFSDGKQIPSDDLELDTTLLTNGIHRISMAIYDYKGGVTNQITTIEVQNPENAFSPLVRWIRLNQKTAVLISSIVGSVLLALAIWLLIRHIKLNKRLLEFRGF